MTTNFSPYSLRNMRPKSKKEANCGYTATLLRNGEPVAYINCGTAPDNDDMEISFFNRSEETFFKHHTAAAVPKEKVTSFMGADEVFLSEMAESVYQAGRRDYFAKGGTLYRLSKDPAGTWRQVKAPLRPGLIAAICAEHPRETISLAPSVAHSG